MNALDKSLIAERFSRAAPTYDASAIVQRMMAERLAAMLPGNDELQAALNGSHRGEAVLDLGCGTGLLTSLLLDRYLGSHVRGIDLAPGMIEHCRMRWPKASRAVFEISDAEEYWPEHPPALVAANCTFQWIAGPDAMLARARSWIAPGGWIALSVLLAGTLNELAESHRAATGRPVPALALWNEAQWRAALERAGWLALPASHAESLAIFYDDPLDVMRGLKEIGASLSNGNGSAPLSAPELRSLARHYRERFGDPASGKVPATYRALFLLAREAS